MGKPKDNDGMKKVKDATDFKKYVAERYKNECYRPQLVLVLYRSGKVLFVKSKSSAWNLPQEGINKDESPEDAFIRCWAEEMLNLDVSKLKYVDAEEMLNLDVSKPKYVDAWDEFKDRIIERYFKDIEHYSHTELTETPGRSRGKFKDGKVYFYSFARYKIEEKEDDELLETYDPEEVKDFEWVDYREARLLMVASGVNWKKRRITERALEKLLKSKDKKLEEICHVKLK